MNSILKISSRLFFSALLASILSCDVIVTTEENKKIESVLLLDFMNYSGKITYDDYSGKINYYIGGDQESYSSYASGFYSNLLSETWITANSDTIANRYIQIVLANINAKGKYTTPTDDIFIEIIDGTTNTWSSDRPGGSAIIEITKYGAIDETIKGTFSGTLKNKCGTNTIIMNNGEFAVKRTVDQ